MSGSLFDDVETPVTRDKIAPDPEIYRRAEETEKDLERVARDLVFAEDDLKKAANLRDQIHVQIAEQEQRTSSVRDEIAADALAEKGTPEQPIDLGNKEKRDTHVAKRLRESAEFQRLDKQLLTLKTELRNAVTDFEMATSRVKSLHRRVDAAVSRARLLSVQISTLGHLVQFDTAKLQLGAHRK